MDRPLAKRVARGAAWSLGGAVLARGLAFAATVLVARSLGTAGFGEFGTIQATVGAVGVFAGFGLGLTATRCLAQWRESDIERSGRIVGLALTLAAGSGTLLAFALVIASPWLAGTTLAAPHLAHSLVLAAALLPLAAVAGVQTGALAGLEAFPQVALANFASGAATFPALLLGVHLGGRDGAILGLVAAQALGTGIGQILLVRRLHAAGIHLRWAGIWQERAVIWGFSLPTALASSLVMPVNWACMAVLARQAGGYEQLGLFNAGNQWRQLVLFVPLQIAAGAMPVLAQIHARGEHARYRRLALGTVGTNAGLAAAAAAAIVLLGPWVLAPFGSSFAQGNAALLPLMAGAVAMTANGALGTALNARGAGWSVFAGTALYGTVAVLLTAVTPLGTSASGLAWAQCIASLGATAALAPALWARPTGKPNA